MGKKLKNNKNQPTKQLTRKEQRKQLRKDKKQGKRKFYEKNNFLNQNQSRANISNSIVVNKNINSKATQPITKASFSSKVNRPNEQLNGRINKQNKQPMKKRINNVQNQSVETRINKIQNSKIVKNKQKSNKKTIIDENEIELLKQQKQIQYYEKLLGVNKKKKKYNNIAKNMGYEDDLFDFLDNISKKVTSNNKYQYNQQNSQEIGQKSDQLDHQQQMDEQSFQQSQDNQNSDENDDQNDDDEQILQQINQQDQYQSNSHQQEQFQQENNQQQEQDQQIEDQQQEQNYGQQLNRSQEMQQQYEGDQQEQMGNQNKQKIIQKANRKQLNKQKAQISNNKKQIQNARPKLFANMTQQQKQKLEIRKQMTGLLNKLSDGNLMITFRQISDIFISNSKNSTISEFISLFVKFNIEVEKPHLHLLLSNIALVSAIHHLIGNRFMAPLAYQIIRKFQQLQQTAQCIQQVQQIGYSKLFQRKKNIIIILCYLYDFKSLTGQFIATLVQNLSKVLNQHHIQFLYLIIQKIGNKIRQNDPAVLKNIIDVLKQAIQKYKAEKKQLDNEKTKIDFIQLQLNELKLNKKALLFSDQRMAFFSTFITKNIPKQLNTERQILLLNYYQIKQANIQKMNWWQNIQSNNKHEDYQQNSQQLQMINQITTERKKLIELAKSLNLVTQIRKNIFIQIMEASDYVQATQKVLSLKIKNLQEIAIVLVHICVLQPTFNPFYSLVAVKISSLIPKFKSKIQFTVWDQIKLLESYNPRKISNLAKFVARFITNPLSNGSLSIIKYFDDLINVSPYQSMFLMIFFTQVFSVSKKQVLLQLAKKLKQESNNSIKQSILQYLSQVGNRQKGFGNLQKMKFFRRMLTISAQQTEENRIF